MNIRRIAVGAGLGFAFTMGALALSSAAHAADKPPAVADCPGGAVGAARLPEKAAARAKAVVDQVAPDKPQRDEPAEEPAEPPAAPAEPEPVSAPEPEPATPSEPAAEPEPEPTPTEEPAPADQPDPATDPRTTEPEPVVDVPPAVVEIPPVLTEDPIVVETPPIVVDPTPTSEPTPTPDPVVITVPDPTVILPATDPAPLPDAETPTVQPRPVPAPALPALPVPLPVVIGPVPASPPTPATVGEMPGAASAVLEEAPDCDSDPLDAVHVDQGLIGQLIDSLTAPAAQPATKAKPGCPSNPKPTPDATGCTGTATTTNSPTGGTHLYADAGTTLTLPILDRIEHCRARSTIPTSRHVAIEPGPA